MTVSGGWNRIRYTLWAPIYDLVAPFARSRRRSLELLNVRPGERVLLLGAGTGADLPYLDPESQVTAVDLTPVMLDRLRTRAAVLGREVEALVGDAERLDFPDGVYDAVILHLILAVAADGGAVAREAARVLKPGGRGVVFDKFVRGSPGLGRRLLNLVTGPLFSDINRRLDALLKGSGLEILHREPAVFRGQYEIALLKKV